MIKWDVVKVENLGKVSIGNVLIKEFVSDGYGIKGLRLLSENGECLEIRGAQYSNTLEVFTISPPKKIRKFRITGTTRNGLVPVDVLLPTKEEAEKILSQERKQAEESGENFALELCEVEVLPEETP